MEPVLGLVLNRAFCACHRSTELTGDDDERAIEQPAIIQFTDESRDGPVDAAFDLHRSPRAVLVRVEPAEGFVRVFNLDETSAVLDQLPSEHAAAGKIMARRHDRRE